MVEDVFKRLHEEQLEQLGERAYMPLQQEREIDGKMDRKTFLEYCSKLVYFINVSKQEMHTIVFLSVYLLCIGISAQN